MASIADGFEYDIFISYRQKDNKYDGWVTEFVTNLRKELEATFKEEISIYFDENPHDRLLETHIVDKSLERKLKCLIFIPVISQTYCDPNSFAWQNEFCAFNKMASEDELGRDIVLLNGNVASRILPLKIHEISEEDQSLIEKETDAVLRSIDFIYIEPGVNRPLIPSDKKSDNQSRTDYRNQINKVANSVKELIEGIRKAGKRSLSDYNTNEPVRRTLKSSKFKKSLLATAIFVVLGVTLFLLFSGGGSGKAKADAGKKSIAVLYFNNMSGDPQQEYLSDGITEEIITKLSMISGIKVTSRTSVYQYKDEKKSTREIAKELGVNNILEGSMRKADNKILVTAHLIDASSDDYIWSETYDRDLSDIFKVQSDIAQHIASKFQLKLTEQERKNILTPPTMNTVAYDKYLLAVSIAYMDWGLGAQPVNLMKSNNLLREAIKLDRDFADAYLMLSWNYSNYSAYVDNPRDWLDSAKLLAKKTIRFKPLKSDGFDALANAFWMEGNAEEALRWQLKSHELDPFKNADMIARVYRSRNEYGKAMDWLLKAIDYDPSEYKYYIGKGEIFYELDLLDSMKMSLDKARRIKPEYFSGEGWAINYNLVKGNYEEFEHLARSRYANFEKEFVYQLAMFNFLQRNWKMADSLYSISTHPDDIDAGLVKIHLGEKSIGTKFLKDGIEKRIHFRDFNGPWNIYDISRIYAALGDRQYIGYLNTATEKKGWHVYSWFRRDPFFDFVRETPEFKELSRQIDEKNERYKADLLAAMNSFYHP